MRMALAPPHPEFACAHKRLRRCDALGCGQGRRGERPPSTQTGRRQNPKSDSISAGRRRIACGARMSRRPDADRNQNRRRAAPRPTVWTQLLRTTRCIPPQHQGLQEVYRMRIAFAPPHPDFACAYKRLRRRDAPRLRARPSG
jgi:hypothetical protein